MKEQDRIARLFEDSYQGHPWIDVTIKDNLEKLDAKKAFTRKMKGCNSIWEIVNHMISWRDNVLQRVQGKIMHPPESNYIAEITDPTEENWQKTLKRFDKSQKEWNKLLTEFKEKDFETIYPPGHLTYYEQIMGILQHDAYHLGQIVILMK